MATFSTIWASGINPKPIAPSTKQINLSTPNPQPRLACPQIPNGGWGLPGSSEDTNSRKHLQFTEAEKDQGATRLGF